MSTTTTTTTTTISQELGDLTGPQAAVMVAVILVLGAALCIFLWGLFK